MSIQYVKSLKGLFSFIFIFFLSLGIYSQGSFDEKILKLLEKLEIYPNKDTYIDELRVNFDLANKQDETRIDELRREGKPDRFYEMYISMNRIVLRQNAIKTLPEATYQKLNPVLSTYTTDIEEVKASAAAYLYAHSSKLLTDGKPDEARQAYDELLILIHLYPNYHDTDKLLRKAIIIGANTIDFEVVNETGKQFSESMIIQLVSAFQDYKSPDIKKSDASHRFSITVKLKDLDVTPDQVKTSAYREERDVLDDQGRTIDTLWCEVTETKQRKSATLKGVVEYYDIRQKRVVHFVPVSVESVYLNSFGVLVGDPAAASEETLKLINKKEPQYPPAESLVQDAVDKFAVHTKEIIWK